MEIRPFLELCAGTWFSQRTRYLFAQQTAENHKSELTITFLTPDRDDLLQLCRQENRDPGACLGGWQVSWSSASDWSAPKQTGSAIVAFIPDVANATGRLLRSTSPNGTPILHGRYSLDADAALTLQLAEGDLGAEERIWFASDNLRLRTSILKQGNSYGQTAFYSEIRKIPTPTQDA